MLSYIFATHNEAALDIHMNQWWCYNGRPMHIKRSGAQILFLLSFVLFLDRCYSPRWLSVEYRSCIQHQYIYFTENMFIYTANATCNVNMKRIQVDPEVYWQCWYYQSTQLFLGNKSCCKRLAPHPPFHGQYWFGSGPIPAIIWIWAGPEHCWLLLSSIHPLRNVCWYNSAGTSCSWFEICFSRSKGTREEAFKQWLANSVFHPHLAECKEGALCLRNDCLNCSSMMTSGSEDAYNLLLRYSFYPSFHLQGRKTTTLWSVSTEKLPLRYKKYKI